MRCEVCGKPNAEYHHVIFRSQGGLTFKYNCKYLCSEHHRGNNSPHKDRNIDLKYKIEMQDKLFKALKEYVQPDDLLEIGLNKNQIKKVLKTLIVQKEGYSREDVVRKLMGGRLYERENEYECVNKCVNFNR